ncbi:3-carboxy-cis,cis-muconate cycloisomerase [Loktanella sp. IMCC34160]|uniref:3-carboxy-cis,cis-muconate cycloisomerase n=1 Tax=Loktanella sp. IMCC34160 TaxID=2510646 RepID=UPI00101BBD96|nr:3-carboxy-cis,cis-muconate cycloisomerase [Loktanella sp. IMCC34160]RYG89143.1 3-carboxy-cis,cis-muconate cycloisomerase [Loktanella sp. IMCC34160]
MISVFEHPWLFGLFGDEEAAALWSAEVQLGHFRAFEAALARAKESAGQVPPNHGEAAASIIETAEIDLHGLARGTGTDGLPIPNLVRQLRAAAGDYHAAVHTGATSQDVMDTALSLTLKALTGLLQDRLKDLDVKLAELTQTQGPNALMGRTRMQAALPITAGDRLASWRQPLASHIAALDALRPQVERLQLGGAVGTRGDSGQAGPQIAAQMASVLGLQDGPVWHTDRSSVAAYAGCLSLITGSLGKIGQDVALMAQQGIDEVTLAAGGGSSAMPHKSNPVLAELLVTLARFNATQLAGMHQALVHEQERSGAAWMLEWMILPQMSVTTARALAASLTLCAQIKSLGNKRAHSI